MLRRLFRGAEERAQATTWGTWPGTPSPTSSGVDVRSGNATQLLAVYGCTKLIAEGIASLPVDVYRERADGTRVEIGKPDWLVMPTTDLDYQSWCEQVLVSLLLDGNAYVAVTTSPATGRIVELLPLDPAQTQVRRESGRKVVYHGGERVPYRVLHLHGPMRPGADVGMSPVEEARQTIGLGMAAVEHGARFFAQGASLSGVIEYDQTVAPERLADIARQWQRKHSGTKNAYLPGVLDGGGKWKPVGVTNEQAQFLESRAFTSAEIAGQMFLVDPSDLGIPVAGTSLTYGNLLERTQRRHQVTFMPWIRKIESALSSLLARPQYVKINVDAQLRGVPKDRWDIYRTAAEINQMAVAAGMEPVLLTSEMRELEDLNPLPGASPTPHQMTEPTPMEGMPDA